MKRFVVMALLCSLALIGRISAVCDPHLSEAFNFPKDPSKPVNDDNPLISVGTDGKTPDGRTVLSIDCSAGETPEQNTGLSSNATQAQKDFISKNNLSGCFILGTLPTGWVGYGCEYAPKQ